MRSDCGTRIGEAFANAAIAVRCARSKTDDRDKFARVIGSSPGRVTAVVGGHDDKVAMAQL